MPRVPQVARVEDCDSDESSVKPGTRREARRRATTSGPPKAIDRYRNGHKDGASDSGYSSHTSGTQASNASASAAAATSMPPPPRPSASRGQSKSRPVIHRSETERSRPSAPSRSASASRQTSGQCDDPNCRHPTCLAVRHPNRGYTATPQYAPQYTAQYATTPVQYQQQVPQYQYQYAQLSQAPTTQTVPALAQPQPRQRSTSRQARPVSIAGYPVPASYNGNQTAPPMTNEAYQSAIAAQWAQYYQRLQAYQQAVNRATTSAQSVPGYPQVSPITTSPTSPNFATAPPLQRTYSTRTGHPAATGYEGSKSQQQPPPLNRTTSARQPSNRASAMPGAYPDVASESSETDSDSESSSSEISSGEYERDRRARARDSRLMSSSSSSQRRPSLKRQYASTPVVPTRSSREVLHRSLQSENVLEYISSSDAMDSDRTAGAVVDRPRTAYTGSSRSSRRPSVSTTASSGRTKATTVSSATSGLANLVLEGKSGRHISYLSKREQDKRYRQYQQQQLEEERRRQEMIEAYQDHVSGPRGPDLTAENIRMQQLRSNGSYFSGHSRAGSRSASKAPSSGGIRIESGGTVIHVYGDSKVQMQPGEDGAPAQFVIGSASGKDSAYHGSSSKSSNSRAGRSRGGSDIDSRRKDSIQEEVAMEEAAT